MNFNTIKLLHQLLDSQHCTTPFYPYSPKKELMQPLLQSDRFPRSSPESQGLSSDGILRLLQELTNDPQLNMHTFLIICNGHVVTEAAWPGQDLQLPKMTFSACKTITALAIGFLIDEGLLQLNTPITKIWEEQLTFREKIRLQGLTIHHLLTMQSGFSFNEGSSMTMPDWICGILGSAINTSGFRYNSMNSYLLSAIVTKITGLRLSEYLKPRLFEPLGITNYYWETCPQGIDIGGWGCYLTAEDMGAIGWLLLQSGVWNGQRLLSESWIQKMTTTHAVTPADYGDFNYGYHIWCSRSSNAFLMNGMLGQNVLCLPSMNTVIVSTAGNNENFQRSRYFDVIQKHIPRLYLPGTPDAYEKLHSYIASLSTISPMGTSSSLPDTVHRQCHSVCSHTWYTDSVSTTGLAPFLLQAIQNNYTQGLSSIGFSIRHNTFIMDWTEGNASYAVAIGWNQAAISNIAVYKEPYRIAAQGRWTQDEDGYPVLKLRLHFQETPFTRLLRFCWKPDRLQLRCEELPGESFLYGSLALFLKPLNTRRYVGPVLDRFDLEYLDCKIKQILSPEIMLYLDRKP